MKLEILRDNLNKKLGERDLLKKQLESTKRSIEVNTTELITVEKAQVVIQTVAKETQEKLKIHLEDTVQTAIDTCFPNKYNFVIEFEIKRGKTEAALYLQQGEDKINPIDSSGGGIVDLAAFALRVASWSISTTDNVLILDEPFKWISKDLIPLAGEILKKLSQVMNLQIIMVTHDQVLVDVADKVFRVSQKEGISTVSV